MSALYTLQKSIQNEFPMLGIEGHQVTADQLMEFIDTYCETERAKYQELKKNNLITWGKFKGMSVKELASTAKGKSYLEWTLRQTWVTPDRFGWFIEECQKEGIQKKNLV